MAKAFYVYTVIKTTTIKEIFEVAAQAGDEATQAIEYNQNQGKLIRREEKVTHTRGKRKRWYNEV